MSTFASVRNATKPPTGKGVNLLDGRQDWARGADIVAAASITLGDDGNLFKVTGATQIDTILGGRDGTEFALWFETGALVSVAGNVITKGGARTPAADEIVVFKIRDNTGLECIETESSAPSGGGGGGIVTTTVTVQTGDAATAGKGISVDASDAGTGITGVKNIPTRTALAQHVAQNMARTEYQWVENDKVIVFDAQPTASLYYYPGSVLTKVALPVWNDGALAGNSQNSFAFSLSEDKTRIAVAYRRRPTAQDEWFIRVGAFDNGANTVTWDSEILLESSQVTNGDIIASMDMLPGTNFGVVSWGLNNGGVSDRVGSAVFDFADGSIGAIIHTEIRAATTNPAFGVTVTAVDTDTIVVYANGGDKTRHHFLLYSRIDTTLSLEFASGEVPFDHGFKASGVFVPHMLPFNGNAAVWTVFNSFDTLTDGYNYLVVNVGGGGTSLSVGTLQLYLAQDQGNVSKNWTMHKKLGDRASNDVSFGIFSGLTPDYGAINEANFDGAALNLVNQIALLDPQADLQTIQTPVCIEISDNKWFNTLQQAAIDTSYSDVDVSGQTKYLGLALTTEIAGADVEVIIKGDYTTAGLTPGVPQYLDFDGNVVETVTPFPLGLSTVDTNLAVDMLLSHTSYSEDIATLDAQVAALESDVATLQSDVVVLQGQVGDTVSKIAGEVLAVGDICMLAADGKMDKTVATAEATSNGALFVSNAIGADTVANDFYTPGSTIVVGGLSVGLPYYLDPTTPGAITSTLPAVSGDIVRVVGYGDENGDLYFLPGATWVEVA